MDGNRRFRSRAIIVKTALRFITKSRRKSLFSGENISSESLSSSEPISYSPNLSKDHYYQQEKYQKRKLSMSVIRQTMTSISQNDKSLENELSFNECSLINE
jgi:hypothetical protein